MFDNITTSGTRQAVPSYPTMGLLVGPGLEVNERENDTRDVDSLTDVNPKGVTLKLTPLPCSFQLMSCIEGNN